MPSVHQLKIAASELSVIRERAKWFQTRFDADEFKKVVSYIHKRASMLIRILERQIKKKEAEEAIEKNPSPKLHVNLRLAHKVEHLHMLLRYYESLSDHSYEDGVAADDTLPNLSAHDRKNILDIIDNEEIRSLVEAHFRKEFGIKRKKGKKTHRT